MRKMFPQFTMIFLLMVFIQETIGGRSFPQGHTQTANNLSVCQTENCKEISAYILNGLDPEKNPCDDFYEFTCGRWRTTNPLPPGKRQWSKFNVLNQQVQSRLIDILEAQNEMNGSKSVALMRKYYRDCMDLDTLDRIGIEPVDSILKKFGDWPLLSNNSGATINWQKLDQHYSQLMGTYSLFDIKGETMIKNLSTYEIEIETPQFSSTSHNPFDDRWKNYQENRRVHRAYVKFLTEIAKIFFQYRKSSYSEEKLKKDISEILTFELELYEAHKNAEDIPSDGKTIKEIQNHYDNLLPVGHNRTADINWFKSIADLFKSVNISISDDQLIYVFKWKYISKLAELLNRTPNHVIVNYIHWNFIATTILFTNEHIRRLSWNVYWEGNAERRPSRQKQCSDECKFRPVLYYEYAKKYFTHRAKENTLRMTEKVRKKALDDVGKSDWLDEATRSALLRKVERMHMMIGYPDWYNDQALTDYYKDLKPGATYVEEMINFRRFSRQIDLKKFRQPWDKYKWLGEPIEASGRYAYYYNEIIFPMVKVRAHDCCNDVPRAVRYGFDGFIIGHEIFHGLDPTGMKWNENRGELRLTEETRKKYNEKVNCLVNEYNGYMLMDTDPRTGEPIWIHTNGTLSKKEDVADNGGIHVAFEAYQEESNKNDLRLPGLEDYDSDKLFFISYASTWCGIATTDWWKETFERSHYDGGHSPVRIRVNNPLKNFDEFAKAFNCKTPDKMIWQSKCTIFNK